MNRPAGRTPWRELPALRIALIYGAASVAWILGSDHLAGLLSGGDPGLLARLQQFKGLFFVLASSGLIFALVHDHHRRLVRAQRQLAAREREVQQAQKMEAVALLAGGVAHDFNNLLQVVNGRTELLLGDGGLSDRHRDGLEAIAGAGQRAARLVGQLLAFSRRQDLQPQDLDLDEVVATLLKLIERTLGASIRIVLEPGAGACTVRADRGQIEQVLLNLCLNARDAMPAGGVLTIATAAVELDERFCRDHPWARRGRFARLRVADTGVGMDAGIQARIWEPFFTTKDPERGTGLGLPTVYGIVRQHAGLVRVRSEEGRGTVFEIYLPAA